MMHIVATMHYRTPADEEPDVKVVGIYDSLADAKAASDARYRVLPVAWSRSSRRPIVGETLSTMREEAGLVAVVLPL